MKPSWLIAFFLLPFLFSPLAVQTPPDAPTCELLLRLTPTLDAAAAPAAQLAAYGLVPRRYLAALDVWSVDCGTADPEQAAARLQASPAFVSVEPNRLMHAAEEAPPNDPYYLPQQDNLRQVGLPAAWARTLGDATPVAVIDTALDLNHPDLRDKIWRNPGEIPENLIDDDLNGYVDDVVGWDFYDNDADPGVDPTGDSSHGTHVAGILAAATNNGLGVAGTTWTNPVMPLRALGRNNSGPYEGVIAAIVYAADNGARVINLSLGGPLPSDFLAAAVTLAAEKGCLLVAAAGNGGDAVLYPAALPEVIAVAAVDDDDRWAELSNTGPEVELAAPGVEVFSTVVGGYAFQTGTSQAAPHVSGTAALIWSLQPDWSAEMVRTTLAATAYDLWSPGRDALTGYGRLDAAAALTAAAPWRLWFLPFAPVGGHMP